MNNYFLILSTLSILSLTACATSSTMPIKPTSSLLENIDNIVVSPETSVGNQASLYKNLNGSCTIQFTGFYTTGKIIEDWQFQGEDILNATSTKVIYTEKSSQNHQFTDLNSTRESLPFDIKNPEKIQNFIKLKSHFNAKKLESCQTKQQIY